jgi:hypothetical protein
MLFTVSARFKIVFVVLLILTCRPLLAQDTAQSVSRKSGDSIPGKKYGLFSYDKNHQRDLADVVLKVLKKDTSNRKDSSGKTSGKVHVSGIPAAGYTLQTGFAGVISSNIAFFLGEHNHESENISSILTSVSYSQYNQIIFPIQADIWTKGNKYNIVTDWRYLKYPSSTFGLGGHTDLNDGYTIDFSYLKFHQTLLKKFAKDFYAGLGFYFDYFWNIREVNPPPGVVTNFQKYGLSPTEKASGIAIDLLYDSRRNQINPNNGLYGNLVYRPNFTFMGSDNNWQSLLLDLRKYLPFPEGSRNVLAFWSYNWLTVGGKPPYLLLPSTGWDTYSNTGRGYIQGRFRGRDMIYLESEYRFGISPNGLFGGVVFLNGQSFSKQISQQFKIVAPGFGAGIRIKLNKFSGANLCLDYGIGTDGSKGFFVNLGEVF